MATECIHLLLGLPTLKNGNNTLSRNVCNILPTNAELQPQRAAI